MHGSTQRLTRQFLVFAALLALIAYVASDAVRGPHGLAANKLLRARIAVLKHDLAALHADRAHLERDAELLGPKAAMQPALIDEQARSLLDLAHPSDIVILNDEKAEQ